MRPKEQAIREIAQDLERLSIGVVSRTRAEAAVRFVVRELEKRGWRPREARS